MKRIYLVKKDERLPAAEDNWIEMNAHQFAQFLKTDTGRKRKNRFLQLDATFEEGDALFYECSEDEYPVWKRERESNLYKNRRQRESGYSIISYIAMTEDGETIEGENVLPDTNTDIEGDLIMRSEIERLIQAVAQLTDDDQNIIRQFFLTQEPISELEYSKINGISQQAAHKRKKAALKKLKEILRE